MKHKIKLDKQCTKNFLLKRIFFMILVLNILIIFFMEFSGKDMKEAFQNSIHIFFGNDFSVIVWGLLIIASCITAFYIKPIQKFHDLFNRGEKIDSKLIKKAAKRFNNLEILIIIISIFAYFAGTMLELSEKQFYKLFSIFGILDAIFTGTFVALILILNINAILFNTKKNLFAGNKDIKPRYVSFYAKLSLIMATIILFMIFKMFDVLFDFYEIGFNKLLEATGPNVIDDKSSIFHMMDTGYIDISKAVGVYLVRVFAMFVFIMQLVNRFKKIMKNQINTVSQSLKGLNAGTINLNHHIDIVDNDEFGDMYKEINTLIDKQRSALETSEMQYEYIIDRIA